MKITNFKTTSSPDHTTVSADFIFDQPFGGKKNKLRLWGRWIAFALQYPQQARRFGFSISRRIWFTIPQQFSQPENMYDAFFLLALPVAIAVKEDLEFDGPVSEELLQKSLRVHEYYREIADRQIDIKVTSKVKNKKIKNKSTNIAQFFTLGVDSFYTLLCEKYEKHAQPRYLIYIDGYDIPFYQRLFLTSVHNELSRVAAATKTTPLFVQSNLRQVTDLAIGWGRFHVTALAAVANLLGMRKVYISGESFESADWGLRAGADDLYSNSACTIQLVAHNVGRAYKIHKILQTPLADLFRQVVRVCWENVRLHDIPYNCSKCQKCLKTQLWFLALGKEQPTTFLPLQSKEIEKIRLVEHVYPEWQNLYSQLKRKKDVDPQVLLSVEKVLQKPVRV